MGEGDGEGEGEGAGATVADSDKQYIKDGWCSHKYLVYNY